MGVGSNTSHWSQTNELHDDDHEFEEEVDEEGEGLVGPPKGRSVNYTVQDDLLLCETYLNVSLDAAVATAQTFNAYWDRMKEYYDTHNKSGIERSNRSLRSRWSLINTDCQKWAGAMAAVDALNPSGTNDVDRVSVSFVYPHHCSFATMCSYLFFSTCSSILHKTCSVEKIRRTRKAR